MSTQRPGYVYRTFDASHNLLYVGSTVNLKWRLTAHKRSAEWWSEVADLRVESFSDQQAARTAERIAIGLEQPRYNIVGTGRPYLRPRRSRRCATTTVAIRLSAEEHAFLKDLAQTQHRSVSGQIRFMVAQLREELEQAA